MDETVLYVGRLRKSGKFRQRCFKWNLELGDPVDRAFETNRRICNNKRLVQFKKVVQGRTFVVSLQGYAYDKICLLLKITVDDYIIARNALIEKDLVPFDGYLFHFRCFRCRTNTLLGSGCAKTVCGGVW